MIEKYFFAENTYPLRHNCCRAMSPPSAPTTRRGRCWVIPNRFTGGFSILLLLLLLLVGDATAKCTTSVSITAQITPVGDVRVVALLHPRGSTREEKCYLYGMVCVPRPTDATASFRCTAPFPSPLYRFPFHPPPRSSRTQRVRLPPVFTHTTQSSAPFVCTCCTLYPYSTVQYTVPRLTFTS